MKLEWALYRRDMEVVVVLIFCLDHVIEELEGLEDFPNLRETLARNLGRLKWHSLRIIYERCAATTVDTCNILTLGL